VLLPGGAAAGLSPEKERMIRRMLQRGLSVSLVADIAEIPEEEVSSLGEAPGAAAVAAPGEPEASVASPSGSDSGASQGQQDEDNATGAESPSGTRFVGHDQALDLGKSLLKRGDFAMSRQILDSIVSQDPQHFDALLSLSLLSDVCHDYPSFADYIGRALEVNPDHAQAWIYQSMCHERRGDIDATLAALARAQDLDPDGAVGRDAAQQMSMLRRNRGCPLLPGTCWREAAPRILGQRPRRAPPQLDERCLSPPRPLFRGQWCIRAWDDALGPDLLAPLRRSVDDLGTYLHRNPKQCRTFWLARDAEPKTAAELAGRVLLEKLLGQRREDFVGIEWWCKNQSANLGAHFHYDMAVADGGFHRPAYSSVLYLANEGGPTVVLDQAADMHSPQWPQVPQEGYVVMPRINRWMVFPGELRHGMMPVDEDIRPRFVILYNFWSSHQPSGPNCQVPDLASYSPVSAKAPTAAHLLPAAQLDALVQSEGARSPGEPGGPTAVAVEALVSPADFECGSDFGELAVRMPMPSLRRMREGPRDAAAFHLPWRRLAGEVLGRSSEAPAVGGGCPLALVERLPLWELRDEGQLLRRRASDIRAWMQSAFVAKAEELARAELVKAVERRSDDCKLGLASLARYICEDLRQRPCTSELNGAFFRRKPLFVEAGPCDLATLHKALYDELKSRLRAEGFGKATCHPAEDGHHGLVMNWVGLHACGG